MLRNFIIMFIVSVIVTYILYREMKQNIIRRNINRRNINRRVQNEYMNDMYKDSIDKLDTLYNNKVSKINKMYAQYTNNQLNKVDDIYDNLRKREHIEELKLLSKYDDYVN